ncbi:hypothetical protein [Metabacillus fastidiosus]|uniref:hypothetical protein n=1 Tax=Metabacillus fastidiosus TaxID=1458 RepID=UPI001471BCF5|nr:hypothetical protein [Metabacillus fastidiosus]
MNTLLERNTNYIRSISKNPEKEKNIDKLIDKLEVHWLNGLHQSYQYHDGNTLPLLEIPIKDMYVEF